MAGVIPGHQFKYALAKQSAEGTPAATAEYSIPVYSASLKAVEDRALFEVAQGDAYRPGQYKVSARAEGAVEWAAFPDSIGRLLTAHLGSDSIVGAGDPYSHTIVNNNAPQWLTVWQGKPLVGGTLEYEKFTDCLVKSADIVYASGQMLRVSTEIIGKKATTKATTPTITTANLLLSANEKFTFVNPVLKLDLNATPAVTTITNLSQFTVHMAYENAVFIGTTTINPAYRDLGLWTLSFSSEFIMQDWAAYYTTFFGSLAPGANTDQSGSVVSGSLEFTITTDPVNANHDLKITCPNMLFAIDAPDVNIDGSGLRVNLAAVTERPASAQPITLVARNAVSTAF